MLFSFNLFSTVLQHLDRPGISFCSRITSDDNAITNAVEIYASSRYLFAPCRGCGTMNFHKQT